MRVVFVSHSAHIGGAELSLVEAAQALAGRVEPHFVLPYDGPLRTLLVDKDIPVSTSRFEWWVKGAPYRKSDRLRDSFWLLRLGPGHVQPLAHRMRSERADLVVSNTLTFPQAAVAARIARMPHIWYVHEFGEEDHELEFTLGKPVSYRLMDLLSARLIACSHAVEQKLARYVSPRKLRTVYYAIDVPRGRAPRRDADPRPFGLLCLGNLRPGKNQEDAVHAFELLRGRGLDVTLRLVGKDTDEYAAKVRALVARSSSPDRVEVIPFSAEPQRYIDDCDVFLMCSRSEAFGRVTIEAMKRGRAVIAARAGANVELIRDEDTGLLYETGDAPSLARQIERLYEDRGALARIARRGSVWANSRFTSERYADELLAVFREALAERRGA